MQGIVKTNKKAATPEDAAANSYTHTSYNAA